MRLKLVVSVISAVVVLAGSHLLLAPSSNAQTPLDFCPAGYGCTAPMPGCTLCSQQCFRGVGGPGDIWAECSWACGRSCPGS